ncbi:MAG: hypothetical protein LCH67_18625 [Bacteroidetes bacterium]|nr:hypothetical protein [Bacteroidota bacterium]
MKLQIISIILLLNVFFCRAQSLLEYNSRNSHQFPVKAVQKLNFVEPISSKKLILPQGVEVNQDYKNLVKRMISEQIKDQSKTLDGYLNFAKDLKTSKALHLQKFSDISARGIFMADSLRSLSIYYADSILCQGELTKSIIDSIANDTSVVSDLPTENLAQKIKEIQFNTNQRLERLALILKKWEKYQNSIKNFEEGIQKIKDELLKSQGNLLGSLPELGNVLGASGLVLPSFNVLGFQDFKADSYSGAIKIFSNANQTKLNDWRSLPLVEGSAFGIQIDLLKAFYEKDRYSNNYGKLKRYGFRLHASYLQKRSFNVTKIAGDSTESFGFSLFHIRPGFELEIFPDVMSVYADYSFQTVMSDLVSIENKMKPLFENLNKLGFFSTGFRFKFSPSGVLTNVAKSNYLTMDLNFVWLTEALQKVAGNTKDRMIPILKIGYKI